MTDLEKKMLTIFNFYLKDVDQETLVIDSQKLQENIKSLRYPIFKVEKKDLFETVKKELKFHESKIMDSVAQIEQKTEDEKVTVDNRSESIDKNESTILEKETLGRSELGPSRVSLEASSSVNGELLNYLGEVAQLNTMILFDLVDNSYDVNLTRTLVHLVASKFLCEAHRSSV